ncbi:hypothetical protein LTR56_027635 [Elasticomyces elasticus]|nr:hypothetical protein LTR56_027635 [Elasticomyces elasticus]KAK3614583.1 hypothetical protein LTR22_027729 [Elasticomyces elasticus]KAK4895352.1 hypothetical protein LTR49_028284 [Elasticomyces elasticus]KAK5732354.1 hypothetical protein LTS12_027136 [Elasticomyces elasticus]
MAMVGGAGPVQLGTQLLWLRSPSIPSFGRPSEATASEHYRLPSVHTPLSRLRTAFLISLSTSLNRFQLGDTMLPSIRYVEQFAAGHDGNLHDSVVQMAPIRSNEQSPPRAFQYERLDSVMQISPVRLERRTLRTAHVGKRHDTILQRMLNYHHGVQSPEWPPDVDRRMKLSINNLLLAPPAAPLVETTNTKRSPSSPASTLQDSPKKQLACKHAFRTTVKAGAGYQAIFPRPKLLACPPSTEALAPGTHLYADSKRWPDRDRLDRSFIKRLAVDDFDAFRPRPAPVIHAPSLLALLQAVTAMTKQKKKSRRRCKGR